MALAAQIASPQGLAFRTSTDAAPAEQVRQTHFVCVWKASSS